MGSTWHRIGWGRAVALLFLSLLSAAGAGTASVATEPAAAGPTPSADEVEFFEKKVRPLLAEHCYKCHSASGGKVRGGLLLDSREGMLKGGETGAAVVPGDVDGSLLIAAVRRTDPELQMPP